MGYTGFPLGIDLAPLPEQMPSALISATETIHGNKDEQHEMQERIHFVET
jgi:hypothetical protein